MKNEPENNKPNNQKENMNIKSGIAPTSIGELRKPKARNTPLIMIFYFAILFVVLIKLPDIYSWIQNIDPSILKPDNSSSSKVELVNNNDQYFEINSSSKIIIDKVVFSSFSIVNSTVQYKITNNNESSININNLNYYLVAYDKNKTVLGTFEIGGVIVGPNSIEDSLTTANSLIMSSIKYIRILEEESIDIPDVQLTINGSGYGVLKCTLNNESYEYQFLENKLKKVTYTSTVYSSESKDYSLDVENYNNMKALYESAAGYVTNISLSSTTSYITFTASLDLLSANRVELGNEFFYAGDMIAKNVNFVVESKGYDCK